MSYAGNEEADSFILRQAREYITAGVQKVRCVQCHSHYSSGMQGWLVNPNVEKLSSPWRVSRATLRRRPCAHLPRVPGTPSRAAAPRPAPHATACAGVHRFE